MNQIILGKTGSGKSRYMYSVIETNVLEGKKGLIYTDIDNGEDFFNLMFEKHREENSLPISGFYDLCFVYENTFDIEDIKYDLTADDFDFLIIDSVINSELLKELLSIPIDFYYIVQVNGNVNYFADFLIKNPNNPTLLLDFNEVIFITTDFNYNVKISKAKVIDKKHLSFFDVLEYDQNVLTYCDFNNSTYLKS